MKKIVSSQIIGFRRSRMKGPLFYGFNPSTNKKIGTPFREAISQEIDECVMLASIAFEKYRKTRIEQKVRFLSAIAHNINALGDVLIAKIHDETGLPHARILAERARTINQIEQFALLLENNIWNEEKVRQGVIVGLPGPKPEIRKIQIPIGVTVVFGASNFPLAFSVAGGDTVSALAAGCPVIFKAHPGHPGTCQLVGEAISDAAKETGMPDGVFSMLHGLSHEVGIKLVIHPLIRAVAFTGSFKGGKAISDLAGHRDVPIPVYAEMGSTNPVFFLPEAIKQRNKDLARQFAASITMGCGQFCTNPGIFIFIESQETQTFLNEVASHLNEIPLHPMLTRSITKNFQSSVQTMLKRRGLTLLTNPLRNEIVPVLLSTTAEYVFKNPDCLDEIFGPSTLAIRSRSIADIYAFIDFIPGQLTASVFTGEKDYDLAASIIDRLMQKAGRVVVNEFPTGVEVCDAMFHGGPFPATTSSRYTSVGTDSIYRFTRPVACQNIPAALQAMISTV